MKFGYGLRDVIEDDYHSFSGNCSIPMLEVVASSHKKILADVYKDTVGMTIWQRKLDHLGDYTASVLSSAPHFAFKAQDDPDQLEHLLKRILPEAQHKDAFVQDIRLLVDMFACLFDLEQVGLRLTALSGAMCPRFHVDKIPCRLVSTYHGQGSEWLHEAHVVREHLGRGGNPTDYNSGLAEKGLIQQLKMGDVAIMKGDDWPASVGRGMVHRSPCASLNDPRLFLSLDMV